MKSMARVEFWGTRGSLAKPGSATLRYGGNTSCVQITSPKGALLVIDCGTGAHDLGRALLSRAKGPLRGNILFSHTHWDHIQGFPFFAPLFVPGGRWDIYGPAGVGKSLRETLAGQMEHTYFPITLDDMGASIQFHDLVEGVFEIEDVRLTAQYLNHPALTLGYRLEMGGVTIVYSCDHEPYARAAGAQNLHELDRRHADFIAGADLLIHDAQFNDAEYPKRKGWGHSPVEYVCELAQLAGVKRVALTHHDPTRTDDALDEFVASVRSKFNLEVFAAADGQCIELEAPSKGVQEPASSDTSSLRSAALKDASVIIGVSDAKLALSLSDAARGDGVRTTLTSDPSAILSLAKSSKPALIILEERGEVDGARVCPELRTFLKDAPIIMVSDREKQMDGVTRWLVTPFSTQYARAQIQALLLGAGSRWIRAPLPTDENQRLNSLRGLSILDTPREERFDRITRVAAALADVPIAVVSLVDENRQWFKSCYGLNASETPRETSFCAHAVASRKPLIVQDTFLDDRFAENPVVLGEPRIRFYAGYPIFHGNGACLGTLCLIDTRPRQVSENLLQRLEDLASMVTKEINTQPA